MLIAVQMQNKNVNISFCPCYQSFNLFGQAYELGFDFYVSLILFRSQCRHVLRILDSSFQK